MSLADRDLSGCSILLVDDEQTILISLRDSLRDVGATVETVSTADHALELLQGRHFHMVVSDVRMPGLSGIDLLGEIGRLGLEIHVILMTAFATVEQAVSAMKLGAYDYVTKPFANEKIVSMAFNIWALIRLRLEVRELRDRDAHSNDLGFIVGNSAPWRKVLETVRMVAPTDSTVLIVGDTGTGKELVAKAVHVKSRRKNGPFVRIHCAALPPTLMETELFGHVRGAFTGAVSDTKGRFELAHGGTLLLDEVDEVPKEIQVKLLRVIQERVIERVGSGRGVPVDVRLMATSKRPLEDLVAEGAFRQDLLYRLSVVRLRLPPLAERRDDIPFLIEHFLGLCCRRMMRQCKGFTPEALALLTRYDYPGNVRELEHAVESSCALAAGDRIGPALLPDAIRAVPAPGATVSVGFHDRRLSEVMDDFERSYLIHALREFEGTRAKLAQHLGISRKNLWQKLKKHGLDVDDNT